MRTSRHSIGLESTPGIDIQTTCYTSDELKKLARIISDILAETRSRCPELSTDDVVQRVCAIADQGERDITKFRQALVKNAA